mmetsp:Transcript_44085/g.65395  ORF Transcript_44085/g.65395 Transcript_44085/m.65395 type:complete len:392 (-) Transcript_44085:95-1270(-)
MTTGIAPPYAWLTVFVPALAYFIGTRFQSGELGEYVSSPPTLAMSLFPKGASLQLVLPNLTGIIASQWRHNEELGRGFLLIGAQNRIWRFEVGGGPIPIGKTLFMDNSGCRSKAFRNCTGSSLEATGSGGMAIDFSGKENPFEGRLAVAEWGEGRVVRVEDTGGRTPLLMTVPDVCTPENETRGERRIEQATSLLYTSFGDLLVVENNIAPCQKSALYLLSQATSIEPIESTWESRKAHHWTSLETPKSVDVLLSLDGPTSIGGLVSDSTWTGVLTTVRRNQKTVLAKITLQDDEDDSFQVKNLLDVSNYCSDAGAIAMDKSGALFLAGDDGVVLISSSLDPLGVLPSTRPKSLTIGEDAYLYVMSDELKRIKVKNGPLKIPTNLLRKTSK